MPDLYSSDLGGNARKTVDTSKFGTRELSFHQVEGLNGVGTNYTDSDSLFFKAVRALQEQVEIYAVGTPDTNNFTVVIAADTCPYDTGESNGDGSRNSRLEGIIRTATGDSNVEVWNSKLRGNYLDNDC
jgi:hypothetical protein